VEPFSTGEVYVNHLDAEEFTRIRGAYSRNYDRLVALKNKYDPTNLFRLNQNIRQTVVSRRRRHGTHQSTRVDEPRKGEGRRVLQSAFGLKELRRSPIRGLR